MDRVAESLRFVNNGLYELLESHPASIARYKVLSNSKATNGFL